MSDSPLKSDAGKTPRAVEVATSESITCDPEAAPRRGRALPRRVPSNPEARQKARRAEVARLYLRGVQNRNRLARLLGVDRKTITKDIKALKRKWEEEAAGMISVEKYLEIVRLQRYEREARDAWEASKLPEVTEEEIVTTSGETTTTTTKKKRRTRYGDLQLLRTMLDLSDRRSAIVKERLKEEQEKAAQTGKGPGVGIAIVGADAYDFHAMSDDMVRQVIRKSEEEDARVEAERRRYGVPASVVDVTSGPEDDPRDDREPTKEEWEEYEIRRRKGEDSGDDDDADGEG